MNFFEESDHAFIIRIWPEDREIEEAPATWRGVIEHVRSGEKQYLNELASIITFIIPYLEEMGIETELLRRWAGESQKHSSCCHPRS